MAFGNLSVEAGVAQLDAFLLEHSYIEGYEPSQADASVFAALGNAPAAKFQNAARWYRHIHSFPGTAVAYNSADAKPAVAAAPAAAAAAAPAADEDDDIDLFGDDDVVDEEAEKLKQARLDEYAKKKADQAAKGKAIIAKSNIILDVKPWDDETDMVEMERLVRTIVADGLIWAQGAKLMPLAFGIKKLQIGCVVEDDKVGTDFLEEEIMKFEDYVQSVDVAAFNKI